MSTSSASAFATTFAFATAGAPFILTCGLPSCAQGQSADVVVAVHIRDCSGNTLTEWDLGGEQQSSHFDKIASDHVPSSEKQD